MEAGIKVGRGRPAESFPRPTVQDLDELLAGPALDREGRDSARRRSLAVADLLGLVLAYATVWLVVPPEADVASRLPLIGALPLWVLLNKLLGLYDRDAHLIHKSTLDEIPKIGLSAVLGTTLLYMLVPPVVGFDLGRPQTMAFAGFAFLWFCVLRGGVRALLLRHQPPERCVIVGSGGVAGMVARKLAVHPEYGVRLVGLVDEPRADRSKEDEVIDLLGDLDDFEELCSRYTVDRVVICFSAITHDRLMDIVRTSKHLGLKITVVPRLFEVIGHQVEVDQLEGTTLLGLRGFGRTRSSLALKRAIDIAGAVVGLVLLAPVMLAIGIAVRLTSRGPALFSHDRVGRGNRHFQMLKFRTMVDGADEMKAELEDLNEAAAPMFKIADDPRITPIGGFLRRTSLDELPQLINVLRGEMSLVGPRPLVPSEDVHVIGFHRERLALTPGLTGPWQVLGRTAIPFEEMIRLDYLYVAEWSLWTDFKLILRTAPLLLQARGQ
jgi:exopolysaccharide biosynthesis polyprenyl glycosylphosphotransferase